MEEQRTHRSLVGPAILIVIGLVLLLNNLGWTQISLWDVLRLWPILLVAGGLDLLIGRRSALGSIVVLILVLSLAGTALWMMSSATPLQAADGTPVSVPLQGAERAQVAVDFPVGTLRIGALSESDSLVEGTVELYGGQEFESFHEVNGRTADVRLGIRKGWSGTVFNWENTKVWDLDLTTDLPIRLTVSAGVGESTIDLARLNLSGLDLDVGVGRMVVILPRQGSFEGRINSGIGELVIRVPEGTAVRLQTNNGLGWSDPALDFEQRDNVISSPGYERSENQINLTVENGIGRIAVERYAGE